MPNWKRVIVSGSDAALNSLEITTHLTASGLIYPTTDGIENQSIITDGAGNLTFGNPSAGFVQIAVKNVSGGALTKGTPVFITGSVGASTTVEVDAADASDASKMPAVGVLSSDLAINGEGFATTAGFLKNITTDPIDGTTPDPNDTIYVKAGGGLTLTKPTGDTNLIQNIGKVGKVSAANGGSIVVSSIMRSNDVPNLPTGKVWVGSSTNTTTSTVVHLDEAEGRLGVGTDAPSETLHVDGVTILEDILQVGADIRSNTNSNQRLNFNANTIGLMVDGTTDAFTLNNSTGNVGIGTLTPAEKLTVEGNISGSGDIILNDNATIGVDGGETLTIGKIAGSGNANLTIDANTTVNRQLTIDNSDGLTFGSTSGANTLKAHTGTTFEFGKIGSGAADYQFTSNVDTVTFLNTGNVGIGTTNPVEKLTVEGNISGSGNVNIVGDVTASAFVGDGSALTGVTAEWDGSHNGDAEITGSLIVSGSGLEVMSTEVISATVTNNNASTHVFDTNSGEVRFQMTTGDSGNTYGLSTYYGGKMSFNAAGALAFISDGSGNTTFGNGTTLLSARVGIKGSGSTSATTCITRAK